MPRDLMALTTFRVIISSSARSIRLITAASASKSQLSPKRSALSLLSSETISSSPTTSRAITSRPTYPRSTTPPSIYQSTSPPPTYRPISPPPPTYQPKKNYFTMTNLYVRYTPLKSVLSIIKRTLSKFGPQTSLSPRIPETPNLPLYIVQGPRDSWSN